MAGFGSFELRARIERDDAVVVLSKIAVLELGAASGKQTEAGPIVVKMAATDPGANRGRVALAEDYSGDA